MGQGLKTSRATRPDTWILRDDVFLTHDPGPGHPETAARLLAIHDNLVSDPVPGTRIVAPRRATAAELGRVHSLAHIDRIAATEGQVRCQLDPDTATSAGSHDAARAAAGAVLAGTEAVIDGRASGAFALVRPPGHHAEADTAMGFCLFNNVAVAAAHATAELGCRRVLILDPDVHHGNGTQHAFYDRSDVLYVSTHRYPFYPGTGALDETGQGDGAGHTVNLPLPPQMGDADFLHLYTEVVDPIVTEFEPDLILVSAGFDTWQHDPLGGMAMTEAGFSALSGLFARWADTFCPGRLVFALEGGYDPAGVVAGVHASLAAATGRLSGPVGFETEVSPSARAVGAAARRRLSSWWSSLAPSR